MKGDICVIGLGIFGFEVATRLEAEGFAVLAVDRDRQKVEAIKEMVTAAAIADITDIDALRELSVERFQQVVLGLGSSFEDMVLGVTYLRKLGVPRITARSNTAIQQEILLKIGADEVILPEKETAERLAKRIALPHIKESLPIGEDLRLAEVEVKEDLAHHSIKDLDLRRRYGLTALMIKRQRGQMRLITDPELRLQAGDHLVVVGGEEAIAEVFG